MFQLDLDDVMSGYRLNWPSPIRAYWLPTVAIVSGSGLTAYIFYLREHCRDGSYLAGWAGGLLFGGLAALFAVFVSRLLSTRRIKKCYAQQASFRDGTTVEWGPDGIELSSVIGSATLPWTRIVKVRENEKSILLYQSDLLFHLLPKRCMTPDQIASFNKIRKATGSRG